MKIITYDMIKALNINARETYDWVLESIENKNDAILPPKISMRAFEGTFCNVMPCIINSTNYYGGVKIVTRYPNREPALDSTILLMNARNGEFLALIDGNWITAMRTGSVAAHSIMLFAKKNFSTISILGLGNVARATVLTLLELNPERNFVFRILKYKGQEYSFVERFINYKNFRYEFIEETNSLIKGADVVISGVTYAPNDLFVDEMFDEGVTVVPIHTLGFTNCDLFFDKVYGDDYGHICGFRNFNKFKSFAEVSDVINGNAMGREDDKERILVYNVGISIHDINFGAHIYERIADSIDTSQLTTGGPEGKFWI